MHGALHCRAWPAKGRERREWTKMSVCAWHGGCENCVRDSSVSTVFVTAASDNPVYETTASVRPVFT